MTGEENGRISNKMIYDKLDKVLSEIGDLKTQTQVNKTRIDNACHDISTLESKSNKNDTIAGIGAFVAAVLGAIGIAK